MTEYELEEILIEYDPDWASRFPDAYVAARFYDIDMGGTQNKARFYLDRQWINATETFDDPGEMAKKS